MSYQHSTKQDWHDDQVDYDSHHAPEGASASASPFRDDHQDSYSQNNSTSFSPTGGPTSPAHSYSNNNHQNNGNHHSPQYQAEHQHQQNDDDDEQYPVGRPLSYFPTHHQPLSQQEFDDEQQRTSQYHQMAPLEHAHSPLSNRTPGWSGGGYSGYQPAQQGAAAGTTDIPLVGIDIISSNLEATRHGNQFSDTRTTENMSSPVRSRSDIRMGHDQGSMYNSGAGVGGADGDGQYSQNQYQQQQQFDNKHGYNSNEQPFEYGQAHEALPAQSPQELGQGGEPIPKALLDPKVQRQLNKRKVWKPWFVWIVSAAQIAVLIFEFVKGYQRTHQIIETNPFNPMIGPGTGTIIVVGARFVPCMRSTYLDNMQIQCPDNTTSICTISDICGFTPIDTTGKPPDQWFRFITPIFLHGGIVHLLFNLMFQLRTGADLERDMGWWRFGIIYMISGIVGFIFGGNFAPLLSPSMGASGAIFGLIGCLVLDLIQNWRLVVRPCWELSKLSLMIIVSFAFGLLPFLDNFAHIGGFFSGILAGLVFMPVVYFSKRDKYIKLGLRIVALPLIVLIIILGLTNFYKGANNCSWCRYLSCLPINGWCDAFNPPAGAPTTGTGGA